MSTPHNDRRESVKSDRDAGLEKPIALHKEQLADEEGPGAAFDYSGAAKTQSPAERKLVRKLDRWIMPTLWAMYWLNYLVCVICLLVEGEGVVWRLGKR
jgi:hypothetical protein